MGKAQAARQAPVTFSQAAQDYVAAVGSVAYDGGLRNPNPLTLIPDGYLERATLVTTLNGTYGTAGPTGVDPLAQFSGPIERLELVGTQNRGLYNLTGEFAGMFTFLDRYYRNRAYQASALVSGAGFNSVALPGTTAFADTWAHEIPLGTRIREFDAPVGLYPIGFAGPPPRINVYYRPTNATTGSPGSGVYIPGGSSTGPNPTGSTDVSQRGYAAITIPSAQPPSNLVRTFREGSQPINGNQTYEIDLSQGAFAVRVILLVIANGTLAPYTNITNIEYDYGFGMRRKVWNSAQFGQYMASLFGSNLPNWMLTLDFYTEQQSMRDWLNTTAVTRPRVYITTSGLTYGGSQNQIRFGVEEFYPFASAVAMSVR